MLRSLTVLAAAALGSAGIAIAGGAGEGHGTHRSPYAGEEAGAIKSLSAEDVDDLLNGRGWGLAKAAELNGMPGPTHVLEMAGEIGLTDEQASAIAAIRERMRAEAIRIGTRLVELEADLDRAFASRTITPQALRQALDEIGAARRDLRYVHLAAHLETPAVLRPEQVRAYNRLRGYAAGPCASPPAGHDAGQWRSHNGCQ